MPRPLPSASGCPAGPTKISSPAPAPPRDRRVARPAGPARARAAPSPHRADPPRAARREPGVHLAAPALGMDARGSVDRALRCRPELRAGAPGRMAARRGRPAPMGVPREGGRAALKARASTSPSFPRTGRPGSGRIVRQRPASSRNLPASSRHRPGGRATRRNVAFAWPVPAMAEWERSAACSTRPGPGCGILCARRSSVCRRRREAALPARLSEHVVTRAVRHQSLTGSAAPRVRTRTFLPGRTRDAPAALHPTSAEGQRDDP